MCLKLVSIALFFFALKMIAGDSDVFFAMRNTISLFKHDRTLHHQIRPGDEPEGAREGFAREQRHTDTLEPAQDEGAD